MEGSIKTRIAVSLVLIVTFIVMMAALMYNPAQSGTISIHVFGKVTDEHGTPLPDATVVFEYAGRGITTTSSDFTQYCEVDDDGQYVAELSSENFNMPGEAIGVAYTIQDSRWMQGRNITLSEEESTIELNFVLVNSTDVFLPVGPIVLASITNGSTQLNISTYLEALNRDVFEFGSYTGGLGTGNVSFNLNTDQESFEIHGINGYLTGSYFDAENDNYNLESYNLIGHTVLSPNDLIQLDYVNKTLDGDYISPSTVMSQSSFYTLTLGESITIVASPENNLTLPKALWPEVNNDILGAILINCTYYDSYLDHLGDEDKYVSDVNTSASVTITPQTPGTHEYQVYIEQGYIIHIWELV